MNIFLAGVHGVGKSFLASQVPQTVGMVWMSASKLIAEELAVPTWGVDKVVDDIGDNQKALVSAVRRRNISGTKLLLDGHFVLIDTEKKFTRLGPDVFESLNLSAVLLLEAPAAIIAERIYARDRREVSSEFLEEFLHEERKQAVLVTEALSLPLQILRQPQIEEFHSALARSL